MEPVPAVGIVAGLVESLRHTLQILEDVASRFASENLGNDFKDAEAAISISHSDLMTIQSNLDVTRMQSQPNDLLVLLEDIEKRLESLRTSIHNVDTLRSEVVLRWQSRVLLRRNTDAAIPCIVVALEIIEMIRVVQGHIRHAKPLMIQGSR